ncbi:MAG: MOSC domain-containing protein [Rhizobiales bacterium]|nr:MOSC domain-containing protein [Hyphomicrobiales bacterium]
MLRTPSTDGIEPDLSRGRPLLMGRLESLHVYPLKSAAGLARDSVRVEAEGLVADRRLMVVGSDDKVLTARAAPGLLTVRCDIDGDEIVLTAPGVTPLVVTRAGLRPMPREVTIWRDRLTPLDVGDAAAAWLSGVLDRECRLVLKGPLTHRPLSIGPGGPVSFADTAPLLLTNAASLADLNLYLEDPVEMARFRPNLVISGPDAYAEDGWGHIRIGEVEFDAVGACDRCVMVTLDPGSGARRDDQEPLAMLGRQRRGEDGKVYFGQFLVPRGPGRLFLGDKVTVLSRKVPVALKPATAPVVGRAVAAPAAAPRTVHGEKTLRCVGVIDETHDVRTFRFRTEPDEAVAYEAGQFITLLFDQDGRRERRNYTLSSAPSRPGELAVTVKRVAGGHRSNWLHDQLRVGDTLRATGPNGRFHLAAAAPDAELLLLSAGSGITPMIAMMRTIADRNLARDIVFHHSARGEADMAFLDELLALSRDKATIRLSWNLTRPAGARAADGARLAAMVASGAIRLLQGRLDAEMLRSVCPDLATRTVMCCGPDSFRQAARRMHEAWQPAVTGRFLEESFGTDDAAARQPETAVPYRVRFRSSGLTAEGVGAVTLLELARTRGLDLAAECEAGICGTCRVRVASGDWRLASNCADPGRSVLSDEDKRQGYVLTCSTQPVGDVEIEL